MSKEFTNMDLFSIKEQSNDKNNSLNEKFFTNKKKKININTPSSRHQRVSSLLCYFLWNCTEIAENIYSFLPAPFTITLPGITENIQPDISIFFRPAKGYLTKYEFIPEIVMEIVSKSSSHDDYFDKFNKYRDAGVLEYWILDFYSKEIIIRYGNRLQHRSKHSLNTVINSHVWKNFSIDMHTIFDILLRNNEI